MDVYPQQHPTMQPSYYINIEVTENHRKTEDVFIAQKTEVIELEKHVLVS